MCIGDSVGRNGKNDGCDVRTVQLLLNMNHPQVAGPLLPDGRCGADTVALIEQFQHGVIGGCDTPGLVTPCTDTTPTDGKVQAGSTLLALRAGLPPGLSEEKLGAVYIHATAATVTRFFAALLAAMTGAGIDTPERQAHFLSQVGHESGELRYTEELASGAAYEGRADLGNTEPGDGPRFKGRGLIQLTGRRNYDLFGRAIGQNFLDGNACCRVANEPELAVAAATWFWQQHKLNRLADADDVLAVTKCINGGTNGLPDRTAKLVRAKWFLLPLHKDATVVATAAPPQAQHATV